jgi:hypothetical protein
MSGGDLSIGYAWPSLVKPQLCQAGINLRPSFSGALKIPSHTTQPPFLSWDSDYAMHFTLTRSKIPGLLSKEAHCYMNEGFGTWHLVRSSTTVAFDTSLFARFLLPSQESDAKASNLLP